MAITKTIPFTLTVVSVPDFTLEVMPTSGIAYAGQTFSISVTAASVDQFAGEVVFSISGYPAGSVVEFLPTDRAVIAPGTPKGVQINITIPADNALVGTYNLVIKAESVNYNGQ
jgi:uncharacterized membrane protein